MPVRDSSPKVLAATNPRRHSSDLPKWMSGTELESSDQEEEPTRSRIAGSYFTAGRDVSEEGRRKKTDNLVDAPSFAVPKPRRNHPACVKTELGSIIARIDYCRENLPAATAP